MHNERGNRLPTGFSTEEVKEYEKNGFVTVANLFDVDEMVPMADAVEGILAELREELRAGDESSAKTFETGVFVGLTLRRPYLRDIFRDERIAGRLRSILGSKLGFLSDKIVFKSEGVAYATPWHQDHQYWGGAHKMSVWIALDPATTGNGCMQFLPGSHLKEVAHDEQEDGKPVTFAHQLETLTSVGLDENDAVTVETRPGGAVFFHDNTLHRSLPNTTGERRRAFIITYRDLSQPDKDYPYLAAAEPID